MIWLENYKREIESWKQIEDSAHRDFRNLQKDYLKQQEEIENMNLSKKLLEKRLRSNKEFYGEEIKSMLKNIK